MSDDPPMCAEKTQDGRACLRALDHKQRHAFAGIDGETCTCMLRWHPNRCAAHPEQNG